MSELPPIQFKLRLPGELHRRLEISAEKSGLSLTAEIVQRLDKSFPTDFEALRLEALKEDLDRHRERIRSYESMLESQPEFLRNNPRMKEAIDREIERVESLVQELLVEIDEAYERLGGLEQGEEQSDERQKKLKEARDALRWAVEEDS